MSTGDARPVKPIALPPNMRAAEIDCEAPEARMVDPCSLLIERAYQRDISEKSIKLIRKIITHWDWAKFKPPICAETASGLFVVDGQHTAIAAASHPAIKQIPVMIVAADLVEKRAESFVSHNRDRLIMTAAQVFHGEVAAGRAGTRELLGVVERAGGSIPRLPIAKGYAKTGQITAVNELRKIYGACGAEVVERIVRIAVLSKLAPISATILIGLRIVLTEGHFAETAKLPDRQLAAGLGSIENIEATSQHFAAESGQSRYRACAALIAAAIKKAPK